MTSLSAETLENRFHLSSAHVQMASMQGELELRLDRTPCDMPVFVKETLQGGGDNVHCSAALSANGWIWMVANRTLIIWRYADDPNARIRSYTLALVATGLQYSADMVCVYKKDTGSLPGVLAVCPEGLVRHWTAPNAAHCDIGIDFRGQVALSLKQVDSRRFLLSTTTDSLYLIVVNSDSSGKQANLSVVQLQSRSMASGIGRRMSSLLWGASPVDGVRLLRTVVIGGETALALTPTTLQIWCLNQEKMESEGNLALLIMPLFLKYVWNLKSKTEQEHYRLQMRVWLIDVVPYKGGALLLAAAHNQAVSVEVHFGLAFIESLDGPGRSVEWFSLIKLKETFAYRSPTDEDTLFSLHLLCPTESARAECKQMEGVLVVSKKSVTSLRLPESLEEESGLIATYYTVFGQELLGAGCDQQYSYVFLRDGGLMSIRLLPKGFDASGIVDSKSLQLSEVRQSSSASSCDDDDGRAALFRMAFIHFAKKEMAKSRASLDELLSGTEGSNDLATLAAGLCLAVVDDMPASDPRWVESVGEQQPQKKLEKQMAGSSLLIHYQLIDKRKTLNLVVSFLKTMDLWPKMKGSVSVTDYRRAPTAQSALTEHAEKLECCIELHGATKQSLPPCLDDAMRSALQRRRERVPPSLTVQDVFYRRVSVFETVLLGLVEYEQHAMTQLATSVERTALIQQVGELLLTVVDTIRKRRMSSGTETDGEAEWTRSDQVLKPLTAHFDLCVEYSSECGSDRRLRSQLLAHAVELVDFILSQQSQPTNDSPLILKLMDLNEDARAIQLAERHRDFPALIRLSERLPKATRDAQIAEWKIKFADDNFADLIYKWYLNSGQQTRLLSERTGDVDDFLAPHPEISWIRDINKNKFDKASQTLVSLALREQHSAAKKKTLLSLAKLCALASDNQDSAVIAETNEHLQVIEHQQRIPKHVITNAGLPEDADQVKPLTPAQIVELSLADPDADEWTFARVLDLVLSMQTAVGHIDNSIQIDRIKLNIWLEALLKDDWAAIVKSEEVEELARNSCFFRTVAAVLKSDYDEDQTLTLLPDTEQLLASSNRLGQLCDNATFQYVVRAGEETYRRHLRNRTADNSMDVA